ncbi:biopolymer transporter ExbD [Povalibacter sp.]|uniref:ExbD/TolR family protein n=1 Tax=Povalibacter sp. TaxID=1962978 RepID=UPI002F3EF760
MKLRPSQDEEPELNLTSLIDVVLLLLIFFMVSTTFVDESRIEIQLPQASAEAPPEVKSAPIEITVTASGEYRVNGKTLLNNSQTTLSAAIAKVAGEERDNPVTIRADARTTHQSVVTAMDVVGRLGFRGINMATVNEAVGTSTP